MSEQLAIQNVNQPNTVETIEDDLRKLGLKEGMTVIVHSSMSSMGWVCGGEQAVVEALMKIVTPNGTLIMPTHSGGLSDPKYWECPPVPKEWWQQIRDTMPPFDSKVTPTRGMGKIVECFRHYEGVKRSYHPTVSFAAWGKNAELIVANHQLAFGLGEYSPLQAIYDLDGSVLLLGVGHTNNTSLHLAEYWSGIFPPIIQGSPIVENGIRIWQEYAELEGDSDIFKEIGKDFETEFEIKTGNVGNAESRLMNQRDLVHFGIQWLLGKSNANEPYQVDKLTQRQWEKENQRNINVACEIHGEEYRQQFEKWGEEWDTAYLTNYELWEFGEETEFIDNVLKNHELELPTPVLEGILNHFKQWKIEDSILAKHPGCNKEKLIRAYQHVMELLFEEIKKRNLKSKNMMN